MIALIQVKHNIKFSDVIAFDGIVFGIPYAIYSIWKLGKPSTGLDNMLNFISAIGYGVGAGISIYYFLRKAGVVGAIPESTKQALRLIQSLP